MKNFVDETYLKGFVPELATSYLRTGETNFTKQKSAAEQVVIQDLINKGYRSYLLRTPLSLRTAGTTVTSTDETGAKSDKDIATRLRLVYNVTVFTTPAATLTLQGTNDSSNETWATVTTATPSATGETSAVFGVTNKYYRINSDCTAAGTIDYDAYLVDTTMDLFFAYKWLEIIFMNLFTETSNNEFFEKMKYFQEAYDKLWNDARIFEDTDESGDVAESEGVPTTKITFGA